MAQQQYPTYDTSMGMNRQTPQQQNQWGTGLSNNLSTGAQAQAGQMRPGAGGSYSNSVANNQNTMANPWANQYNAASQARGGAPGSSRPAQPYQPGAMPGAETPTKDASGGQYWNPTYPTQQQPTQQQPQPATAPGWQNMPGMSLDWFAQDANREQGLEYIQAMIPYNQLMQNQYQYQQDFNEAQNRWNQQFGWQQNLDQFNTQLAGRQQTMAEWQANEAARQWAAQFGQTQQRDTFEMGLADRQFNLQDWQQREQLRLQEANQQGQLAQGNRQLDITDAYNQGRLGIDSRNLDIQQQYNTGRLGVDNRQLDIQSWMNQAQIAVQNRAQDIDQMYRSGQLSNEQRQLALAELSQQQNYALAQLTQAQRNSIEQGQLGLSQQELAATQQYRQQQEQLARAQLAQEMEIARMRWAQDKEIATMQATGRNQAPNARWIRAA